MEPKLIDYITRLKTDQSLLEKYPEKEEMLVKRIEKTKENIIAHITTDEFIQTIRHLNI